MAGIARLPLQVLHVRVQPRREDAKHRAPAAKLGARCVEEGLCVEKIGVTERGEEKANPHLNAQTRIPTTNPKVLWDLRNTVEQVGWRAPAQSARQKIPLRFKPITQVL